MRARFAVTLALVGCLGQRSYLPSPATPLPDTERTTARTMLDEVPLPATVPAGPESVRPLVAGPIVPAWQATPRRIFALQQALATRGYYQGPQNGAPSPALDDAVRTFQADAGLPITGRIDAATARALGL